MMEQRETARWTVTPTLLGFGVMRMPLNAEGTIDRERSDAMLRLAYESGVTYYDTAYTYHNGESEPYLGSFLKGHERSTYQVATKLPCWQVESLDDARRIFSNQAERLGVSYFDFYLLHSLDKATFLKMVALGVLDYLIAEQKAGRIIHLGFSFHQIYEEFEFILRYRSWDFCQIQYNFLDIEEQAGRAGYELATALGIPVIVMEPIKGGSLMNIGDDLKGRIAALDRDATLASYALRWVADHPNVKVILSGMSTLEHVRENIETLRNSVPLSSEEQETIDYISETMLSRLGNSCTGCSYCMPCPFGVDIPGNFALWNKARMFESYQAIANEWEDTGRQDTRPPSCTECGVCIPLCPQNIDIPADLKIVQQELTALRG